MDSKMVKLGENGRLVIPAPFRAAMQIEPGDELVVILGDGEIRITTRARAIARVQREVRKYVPEGVSLVDELIAERRAEAAAE